MGREKYGGCARTERGRHDRRDANGQREREEEQPAYARTAIRWEAIAQRKNASGTGRATDAELPQELPQLCAVSPLSFAARDDGGQLTTNS